MKPPLVMLLFLAVGTGIGPFTHPVARSGEKTPTTLTCPTGKPSRLDCARRPAPRRAPSPGSGRSGCGTGTSSPASCSRATASRSSRPIYYSGVHVWDAADGKEVRRFFANDRCQRLAISPDGRVLAVALGDLTVRLCDPTSGRELGQLPSDRDSITEVVFSYDGSLLATRTGGKSVRVYDVATQKLLYTATFPANVGKVAFSSDGKLLACGTANGVCLWHLAERREVGRLRERPGREELPLCHFRTSRRCDGRMGLRRRVDPIVQCARRQGNPATAIETETRTTKSTDPWGSAGQHGREFFSEREDPRREPRRRPDRSLGRRERQETAHARLR